MVLAEDHIIERSNDRTTPRNNFPALCVCQRTPDSCRQLVKSQFSRRGFCGETRFAKNGRKCVCITYNLLGSRNVPLGIMRVHCAFFPCEYVFMRYESPRGGVSLFPGFVFSGSHTTSKLGTKLPAWRHRATELHYDLLTNLEQCRAMPPILAVLFDFACFF